jgi:PAS domain S-box-containing protein
MFISAIGAARLPMLLTDPRSPENAIVFANQAFVTLTGYELGEVLGRNCRFLQGPDTDPASVTALRDAIHAQQEISIQLLNYRKDGASFWNELHISPVHGTDGELIHFFACQLDVSQWRAAESAMAEAQKLQILSHLILEKGKDERASSASLGATLAAVKRWREMDRLATHAANNLLRREIALTGGQPTPPLGPDRLLVSQLQEASTRARAEALALLDQRKK